MKSMIGIAFCIFMFPAMAQAQEPSSPRAPVIVEPDKFDEWGDIRFNDEKAHLDKIAIQAKQWPLSIIYLVIHAGQTACVGEAKARGIRAKNYLMKKGISYNRIVRIDAGWRKNVTSEVWIWPPELGKPSLFSEFNLKPDEVKLQRNCKIKYRGH